VWGGIAVGGVDHGEGRLAAGKIRRFADDLFELVVTLDR